MESLGPTLLAPTTSSSPAPYILPQDADEVLASLPLANTAFLTYP